MPLAHGEGLAYRGGAEHLAEPPGRATSRMRKGLTRLCDCLGVTA